MSERSAYRLDAHPVKPNFIDLFCGCGGFSLGMERAGFKCLAAVDFNPQAVQVFRENFKHVSCVLEKDLTQFTPEELADLIGTRIVDVVVGGPPCQGFSTARQRDGANHGDRLKPDPRRHLYREYLKFIEFFQPKIFVMENVLGLRTAAGGEFFTRVQHEARTLGSEKNLPGYRVHSQIEDAYQLGVPQKRRRQLIVGVRNDLPGYFPSELKAPKRARPETNLGAAIGDLPPLDAGEGEELTEYSLALRQLHARRVGSSAWNYLNKVLEISKAKKLTAHRARPHSARDLGDFLKLAEGQSSAQAMRLGVKFAFPYDKENFSDRYTRQSRYAPCSTIVAHLSKDGLMFIHPTQNRSLTVREAARVQSFPDWFQLPVARTHQFRIIGNAVPPLVSEAFGNATSKFLGRILREQSNIRKLGSVTFPSNSRRPREYHTSRENAFEVLTSAKGEVLRTLPAETFMKIWHALLYTFPDLHPDNATDHGKETYTSTSHSGLSQELRERYVRSNWPVAFAQIGLEAWRRFKAGMIMHEDFYFEPAQRAGLLQNGLAHRI